MKEQPTPHVTGEDVFRFVRRDFPPPMHATVLAALNRYGTESWHGAVSRVRLAVLKLANGDLNILRSQIDIACQDYRDVIACAEYPAYSRHPAGKPFAPDEQARVFAADWAQYAAWLNGHSGPRSGA